MDWLIEQFRTMFNVSSWEISTVDVGVMLGYLLLMMVVGWLCKGISKDVSDYVRMGCKSTWWLMGTSIFMLMTSAGTFTGGAAQAYMSGWSFLLMSLGSLFGYLCMMFFAPWMRRTRAVTPPDTIRLRYGPFVEQINAYLGAVGGMLWGGTWLLALGQFMAVVFNVPVPTVILFVGIVVVFYSVSGGSWSVQITDTLQAYILVPIALVVLFLSLRQVGWLGGLMQGIADKGLQDDYKVIMEVGHQYKSSAAKVGLGYFSFGWLVASLIYNFVLSANMTACWRFLSVKSDTDARKAAILAGVLLCLGTFVWYMPAMVGRILYEDEINAMGKNVVVANVETPSEEAAEESEVEGASPTGQPADEGQAQKVAAAGAAAADEQPETTAKDDARKLNNPADGAYAFVAKKVLPPGLLGLVVIGLFAATMSSLDSSLTGNAGLVTNNIYPPLARLFGQVPWTGMKLLRLTQVINLLLGAWAIILAMLLYKMTGEKSLFDIGQEIINLVSTPMVLAMALSFFVPWLPWWAPLVGMFFGFSGSLTFMFAGQIADWMSGFSWLPADWPDGLRNFGEWVNGLMWHHRMYINMGLTLIPTFATCAFWFTATPEYRKRVDNFFRQIRTPIDFKKEVGKDMDHSLMKIIGILGLVIAGAILVLIPFARDAEGVVETSSVMAVLFVSACVGGISLVMLLIGRAKGRARQLEDDAENAAGGGSCTR
ncbi:MAG: hypothetical protein JXL80_08520 [Planctomycetes bacterium]|nr:hypothetical protein [Planctomycetota bacterium]